MRFLSGGTMMMWMACIGGEIISLSIYKSLVYKLGLDFRNYPLKFLSAPKHLKRYPMSSSLQMPFPWSKVIWLHRLHDPENFHCYWLALNIVLSKLEFSVLCSMCVLVPIRHPQRITLDDGCWAMEVSALLPRGLAFSLKSGLEFHV